MEQIRTKKLLFVALLLAVVFGVFLFLRPDHAQKPNGQLQIFKSNPCTEECPEQNESSGQIEMELGADKISETTIDVDTIERTGQRIRSQLVTNSQLDNDFPFFFLSELEYREVSRYWNEQFKADRASWVDTLEHAFLDENRAPDSADKEALAALATIEDPKFRYEPPITVSDVVATCRNDICKVEIPSSIKSFAVRNIPISDKNDILHPNDRVLFDHGFGHNVSHLNTITGIRTNYYLTNGFEFTN